MEHSWCTEDRIQHVLDRCVCDLGQDTDHKHAWDAGLCLNRWCLEELVSRDPQNFLILLQKILRKSEEVLRECQYDQVVALSLLFSSTLLKAPFVARDSAVVSDACVLFHRFLSWPEPCSSASKRLLGLLRQELRAPGISFHRLVRAEQELPGEGLTCKTRTVLLVSPHEEVAPELVSALDRLSGSGSGSRDVLVSLLCHSFQSVLGPELRLQDLSSALQVRQTEELERLLEAVTQNMEAAAASPADVGVARKQLVDAMETLGKNLRLPVAPDHTGRLETFRLPMPPCLTHTWESDSFDFLADLLEGRSDSGSPADEDNIEAAANEGEEPEGGEADDRFENHRISGHPPSASRSVPSTRSGAERDPSEDPEDGPKPRMKPKKKSRSLLGVERLSMFFRNPRSPAPCRRTQSLCHHGDAPDEAGLRPPGSGSAWDGSSPQKHLCVRRRPILSVDEADGPAAPTLVRLVAFGGDREAGRLARAYAHLQLKEGRSPRLTRTCALRLYLVPTRGRTGSAGGRAAREAQTGGAARAAASESPEDESARVSRMLAAVDPWYERNVLSLLSVTSDLLCQSTRKEGDALKGGGLAEPRPLLAELVLYYCRHAEQQLLVPLYQAELTLAAGETRREVFVQSLELGHSAAIRAVRGMGSAGKRLGIDEEWRAAPFTLSVAYNKVCVSGRSQWIEAETTFTSMTLQRSCRKSELLCDDSTTETLQLTITEGLKGSKSKKNQPGQVSEVKVNRLQVSAGEDGATFSVCLDQDQRTFIQSVTRCDVCLCSKTGSGSDWRRPAAARGRVEPLNPRFCSVLCLPVSCFSHRY